METAAARIADGNGASERRMATEPAGVVPQDVVATRPDYITDLYRAVDEIEQFFPELVRRLRRRIENLERFLAADKNPYIQHGIVAATHEAVQAVHRVIRRIVGVEEVDPNVEVKPKPDAEA